MPRTSLSALEILLRQTKADGELDSLPEVRKCLLSETRSLQKAGLPRSEMHVAIGLLHCLRALLTAIPSGRLKTPEGLNLLVRITEQVHKANSALRRRGRAVPKWSNRGRPVPVPTSRPHRDDDEPEDIEDDSGNEAARED